MALPLWCRPGEGLSLQLILTTLGPGLCGAVIIHRAADGDGAAGLFSDGAVPAEADAIRRFFALGGSDVCRAANGNVAAEGVHSAADSRSTFAARG